MTVQTLETELGPMVVHEFGQGPPLLFLHGLLANQDLWRGVVDELQATHRCIVPVLPLGAHSTPVTNRDALTPDGLADAMAEVLRAVAPNGATIVANDTGGVIAQLLVTRHSALCTSLILTSCDAFSNFLPWSLRYIQLLARIPGGVWLIVQLLRVPLVRKLPIAFGWLTIRPVSAEQWASYLGPSRVSREIRRDLGKFLRSISTRYTKRAAVELAGYERPVLLPWANTRRVFPFKHAERLAEILPDARVVAIERSRAFVPHDQPVLLGELIAEFSRDHHH